MKEYWLIDEDGDAVAVVDSNYAPMAGEQVVVVDVKGIPERGPVEVERNGHVGDVTSNERGSGARFSGGKPNFGLMPMHLLVSTVRVWEYGAQKYAAWNWAKGMPWSEPLNCILRHVMCLQAGEILDPETGQPHWAHIICNCQMLEHYYHNYPEGNDLVDDEMFDLEAYRTPEGVWKI